MVKRRSSAWYLLPLFFSIVGGVIGYFIIKNDDPVKAKRLLIVGLVVVGLGLANVAVQTSVVIASAGDQFLSIVSPALSLVT